MPRPERCRHCGKPAPTRARGLCSRCYSTPGVRGLYPSRSNRHDDFFGGHGEPDLPTGELPGTEEKMLVLAGRVLAGVSLWHGRDGRFDLD